MRWSSTARGPEPELRDRSALIAQLKGFEPFEHFTEDELALVAMRSEVGRSRKGEHLFSLGDRDPWIYCLLEGELRLVAEDGRTVRVVAGTKPAQRPVAQLKPRKYSGIAETPARYIRIDGTGFGDFANGIDISGYFVTEVEEQVDGEGGDEHYRRILDGHLALPSLPSVAIEVSRLIESEEASTKSIATAIGRDPAIAAKLLKAANSAIYYGKGGVDSCERAVARLGLKTTRQLVLAFSVTELFTATSPLLVSRMAALLEHSIEVAAIAAALARRLGGFDPGEAQLAGLLHDVGVVPVLTYAQSHPELAEDAALDGLIESLRAPIGKRLLVAWRLPSPLVTVVEDAESWWRDPSPQADLADLIVMTQLISLLGGSRARDVPPFPRLPAFHKVARGKLDPAGVLALLEEAAPEIAEARSLLRGGV
jgi:HD-like signal output (HDOD) protein